MSTLRKKDFVQWLQEHKDEVIGYACTDDRCPIATYYVDNGAEPDISVEGSVGGDVWYRKNGRDYVAQLPKWALDFIKAVDKPSYVQREVTAEVLGIE